MGRLELLHVGLGNLAFEVAFLIELEGYWLLSNLDNFLLEGNAHTKLDVVATFEELALDLGEVLGSRFVV